ncbi:MAG: aminotransferase class V-fold PLP-dependent enzyme [Eubacteriales bacterium]|nr:aminotransferase class V-fold PLP-dependent enzyme [Eubacteriales bacterium]
MEKERMREQNGRIGALMKDFVDRTADFYDHLKSQPVIRPTEESALQRLEQETIPAHGRDVEKVYEEMLRDVYSGTLLAQHPRSFACVPSTASMLSWMGDVMTNAYNPHASCRNNAPAIDLIEKKLIRWMCGLAGYPEGSGGLFVSGGSIANLTALTAARDTRLRADERSRAVVYLSDQTHASVVKGLHMIGFTDGQIRRIPTDEEFCIDVGALEREVRRDLERGRKPFAAIASAGTTNTGSVDPMTEISGVCRSFGMWLHVDGAFGASALLSEQRGAALQGIGLSDSISWDAHKWLMQTYGCSVVLVRDRVALSGSFAAHPEYLRDAAGAEESVEFWDLGPELTRPARCLKLWITLQTAGTDAMGRVIEHGCALAELAQRELERMDGWEIVSPARLGVLNFRYVPDGGMAQEELAEVNRRIAGRITESGYAQIFTTQLRAKTVLRMCTIHPETTEEDVLGTLDRLRRYALETVGKL